MDASASAALRQAFMRFALQRILAGELRHPLAFLVDWETRCWCARTAASPYPTVQAGHLASRHSGLPERFALEDSWFNQVSSNVGETQGAIFLKAALEIGGVPVETRTAGMWERIGALPRGTVRRARPTPGWSG